MTKFPSKLIRKSFLFSGSLAAWAGLVAADDGGHVDFSRDVRPILADNCFKCHGFDEAGRKARLRLDEREGAIHPAKSGDIAIVPGKPEDSELLDRVTSTDKDEAMPPPETEKKLKPEQIATLRRWIAEGAVYARHWSFEKPVKAALPKVGTEDWPRQPIDYFVLARLEKEGLKPSSDADRTVLARRLALDLTGLPPTLEERDAFLNDPSPEAYERYVDHLLAAPAYGEHWARHWLDLARYADTKGYEKDLQRTVWRYRDWVIDAFNADMPYDEFTRDQLAGDLLPNPTNAQMLATAFHRNTMTNEEGGVDAEEYRIIAVKDRVDTTMQVWMGLTMGCAKCHSHKFDPIAQREYYQFYAFFNETEDANRGDDSPTLPTPTPEEEVRRDRLKEAVAKAERALANPPPRTAAEMQAWETETKKATEWQVIRPATMEAASGAKLEQQADGAVLVRGDGSVSETYTLNFPAGSNRLTGLRLEALPDAANPKGGVGRSRNDGNFVLTGIHLMARSADGSQTEIPFGKAVADFSQADYPVEHVLKNPDPKHHGWAVSPQLTQPHTAVFTVEKPAALANGTELTLTLDHQFEYAYPGFSIGKFRVAWTSDDAPAAGASVPAKIVEITKLPSEQRSAAQQSELAQAFQQFAPQTESLRAAVAKAKADLTAFKVTQTPVMRELPENRRRVTRLQNRGNFLDPGDPVTAGVPAAFPPLPKDAPLNRLGVAEWLCDRENPLTTRVAVNRIWASLFGTGLVETQEDFGTQGTAPTHPRVLDWLAVDFMEQGWSFKKLLKTIVMSATYRQSSRASAEAVERDRFNKLLARGPRFRLEAETIRDQALAVSGLLSRKMYGPSVMPYQPPGLWKSTYSNAQWATSPGEDRYRRGLYTFIKRTTPYPEMLTFDGTSRESCTIRRARTNTPLQALATLNDPVFVECAQALARKMQAIGGKVEEQLAAGMRTALLREPQPAELAALAELYRQRLEAGRRDPAGAEKLAAEPLGPLPPKADVAQLAALTAVANVILNLDEFLTRS